MIHAAKTRKRWSKEETILALYLYFQTPFGRIHSNNPEIKQLASAIGRTNDSVAMKLANFASLDPNIIASGRRGLSGASVLDRETYLEFAQDWSGLVHRADGLWSEVVDKNFVLNIEQKVRDDPEPFEFLAYEGPSTAKTLITTRLGQSFFRRSVLANFEDACCITGIADARLLTASHIIPWSDDPSNRHNPSNGLLLSATLDRAFDRGLITVGPDLRVRVSNSLIRHPSHETRGYFIQFNGMKLRAPRRFAPNASFLEWHGANRFVDAVCIDGKSEL